MEPRQAAKGGDSKQNSTSNSNNSNNRSNNNSSINSNIGSNKNMNNKQEALEAPARAEGASVAKQHLRIPSMTATSPKIKIESRNKPQSLSPLSGLGFGRIPEPSPKKWWML